MYIHRERYFKIIPLKNKIYREKYWKKIYTHQYIVIIESAYTVFTVGPSLAVGECLTETMGFSSDKPSGNNFSTVEDLIN